MDNSSIKKLAIIINTIILMSCSSGNKDSHSKSIDNHSDSMLTIGRNNGDVSISLEVNGIRNGFHIEYYENGEIKKLSNYDNGKLHGIRYTFFPNGFLYECRPFSNGVCHGDVLLYNIRGELKEIITVNNDSMTNRNILIETQ